MVVAVERVSSKRTIRVNSLRGISKKFLRKEVLGFATQVSLEEVRGQAALSPPNLPNRVVFDGRKARDLKEPEVKALLVQGGNVVFPDMKRFVRFEFTGSLAIAKAFVAAWKRLKSLTPRDSSEAFGSYYFYVKDFDNPARSGVIRTGKNPDGGVARIIRWVGQATSNNISIHILGPTVEYRRTVIYRGGGRPKRDKEFSAPAEADRTRLSGSGEKARARAKDKPKGGSRVQFQLQRAIQKITANQMNRKFRALRFRYYFIRSREPLRIVDPNWKPDRENIHIPVLIITPKRGGQR